MILGLVAGVVIGLLVRSRRREDVVSAAWFKDRLQLGRENHD